MNAQPSTLNSQPVPLRELIQCAEGRFTVFGRVPVHRAAKVPMQKKPKRFYANCTN
jgi:hypothetical protein